MRSPTREPPGYGYGSPLTRDQTRSVFGQVMGLVALTFAAVWRSAPSSPVTRPASGAGFIFMFIAAIGLGMPSGSSWAVVPRSRTARNWRSCFGMGLCCSGWGSDRCSACYTSADPERGLPRRGACTAGFIAAGGELRLRHSP